MVTKHILLGLIFGASASVVSWIVGMVVNSILMKTDYYHKVSSLNFLEGKDWNKRIGLKYFKWTVKNTPFKVFNPGLTIKSKHTDLNELRRQMTFSEISHLIGFLFVLIIAICYSVVTSLPFGLAMIIPNVLLNLYPSLLQQENKRRIDQLIKRYKL